MAGFSRRAVNKGVLMLGLGSAAAASVRPARATEQQKPTRGGTFTAVFINEPASMDPVLGNNPGNDGRSYNLFAEKLLYQDFAGTYKPQLAEGWDISDDGRTVTFRLRKGVKFQDGTDFDAAAVKANLDRARNPTPQSRTAPYLTSLRVGRGRRRSHRQGAPRGPLAVVPRDAFGRSRHDGFADRGRQAGREFQPRAGRHRAVPTHLLVRGTDRGGAVGRLLAEATRTAISFRISTRS